ncbi:hypothetical protein [Pseudolactococcus insecticola]|uniref:Uncharacterized protein n=1 Tax=Pseudolactococcus insecticola TaxID=2709158 RepID=A0A6A0BAF0_9LACT|nr:hypothetical protein [Lactococcus insecticola]GFH41428.1 hypothetical protein Hs20B_18260 [Lactococcus insecticola]
MSNSLKKPSKSMTFEEARAIAKETNLPIVEKLIDYLLDELEKNYCKKTNEKEITTK